MFCCRLYSSSAAPHAFLQDGLAYRCDCWTTWHRQDTDSVTAQPPLVVCTHGPGHVNSSPCTSNNCQSLLRVPESSFLLHQKVKVFEEHSTISLTHWQQPATENNRRIISYGWVIMFNHIFPTSKFHVSHVIITYTLVKFDAKCVKDDKISLCPRTVVEFQWGFQWTLRNIQGNLDRIVS